MLRTTALLVSVLMLGAAASSPKPVAVPVTVATSLGDHQSGRLIVFIERAKPSAKTSAVVDFDAFAPAGATVAAREVTDLRPSTAALVDTETDAFPQPLSKLAPGRYRIQAVLDRNHDYAYSGRSAGDLMSNVVTVTLPGPIPTLTLNADGKAPPMIWVYLDHAAGTGTHEFADSANNGPWGTALISELIPALEREYKMDARPSGRFLVGHSSGGWSTLWLQVRYPKVFGGSWPTSPDPSDFHDFTNVNIYAPNANLYTDADGKPRPLIRDKGRVVANLIDFARSEAVMGAYGGQITSFEWVFSPRARDGRPVPLFDRATGRIDPAVAAYRRENYDIANIIRRDWQTLKPDLDGKIHLTVGTADTFCLDGPAHRLEAVMREIGAKTDFRYLPGKTHFDLYVRGDDKEALLKDIAWEMYSVARPDAKRPN